MKKTLLKLTVACALALAIAPSAHAQLLAKDAFYTAGGSGAGNYNVGAVSGQNPTTNITGFNGAWSAQNFGGGSGPTVSATPISYSGTTGYGVPIGGGSLVNASAQVRAARALTTAVTNAFTATSGTVYMSFDLQLTSLGTGIPQVYQALELGSDATGGPRFLQLGYSTFGDFGGSNPNFAVRLNDSGSLVANLGVADTAAHLFVLAFTLGSGSTDSLTVYEDPTSMLGSNPTGGTQATISGFSAVNTPGFLEFATFSGGGAVTGTTLSDVRIGQTLPDIAAVPEVPTSSLTLLGLGALVVVMVRRNKLASQI